MSERAVSGAELAGDELLLRQVFGLLVHAHYRTTPGDLHRLLDAPNLAVHVLEHGGAVVAACLLAREGALSEATCVELAQGRRRLRGHALADTLVTHAGRPAAGQLSMVRSVRIATHPALRRRGLARHLVERVHLTCEADLFGTIFGATPELLRFRRSLGYRLVRVGGSRGERTGAPAAVMLRPACLEAEALVAELQEVLARNLPAQLALMSADGDPSLGVGLAESLMVGLPEATPWTEEALQGELVGYLHGPRTQDAVADALRCWVGAREVLLDDLEPGSRLLVEQRILAGLGWKALTSGAGLPSVPAAQRALRRALRELEALRRAGSP